jgi:hypothetical protein
MSFCTRCGSPIADGAGFCGHCGAAIAPATSLAQPGWNGAPSPAVVQVVPTAYVIARPPKSVGAAILLTFLFGPFGMLYSTVPGALIMMVVSLVLAVPTAGISVFITWPICVIWGAVAAQSYNEGRR